MAKSTSSSSRKRSPAKRPLDVKLYNDVVDSAVLNTVQALKIDFDVKPEFYDESATKKFSIDRALLGVTFDPDGGAVAVTFRFSVHVKQGRVRVLKAVADYLVIYDIHEGASIPEAEAFCRRVGVFAAYPYFRALMAQLSWEANAQLPIMPVIATRPTPVKALLPED